MAAKQHKPADNSLLCTQCKHGGCHSGNTVRCMHPHWDEIGEPELSEHREMDPSFAEVCTDFAFKI